MKPSDSSSDRRSFLSFSAGPGASLFLQRELQRNAAQSGSSAAAGALCSRLQGGSFPICLLWPRICRGRAGTSHHARNGKQSFPGAVFAYGPSTAHTIRSSAEAPLVKYFIDFCGSGAPRIISRKVLGPHGIAYLHDGQNRSRSLRTNTRRGHPGWTARPEALRPAAPIAFLENRGKCAKSVGDS